MIERPELPRARRIRCRAVRLRQTQLASARDSFGAPLDLEFAKDPPVVSFHRVQGEEEPLDQAWPEYNSRRRWGNVKFSGENWS
jgi:hypothetical protein